MIPTLRALGISLGVLLVAVTASGQDDSRLVAARGSAKAPVTILLFSDFQCPYCARVGPVLDELERRLPGRAQVVFKHMPLPIHPEAPLAHEAALAAAASGKFWEMHDLLFANQKKLDPRSLLDYARQIGLNADAVERALGEGRHRAVVDRDLREAQALGVNATPTLFVNGRRLVGVPSITPGRLPLTVSTLLARTPEARRVLLLPSSSSRTCSAASARARRAP
jgi:protein-disulfide isomerase